MPEEAQAGEGYLCSCGQKFISKTEFSRHFQHPPQDGQEHKSKGRVNFQTGEITMPPWNERTQAQKKASIRARKIDNPTGVKPKSVPVPSRSTEILSNAMQITMVPRVYTIDFTPIMRSGLEASQRVWGWRPDMPLANFLDTVIYNYFKEHGITLAAYVVEETEEEREAREELLRRLAEEKLRAEEEAKQQAEAEKEKVAA